ncbi:MAG: acyltransferase [Akkermansia sp.]|nr:acyltransferase [Akkermansia sp.]
MPSSRIQWIDFCRVWTAFFVVLRHVDRPYGSFNYIIDLFNYRSLIFFFFLAAGYFTHKAAAGQWLDWKRARTLLVPFIFWTAVASILLLQPMMHWGQTLAGDFSWFNWELVPREMGLLNWCYWDFDNVPLWFLRTLILLALFSPLLQRLSGKLLLVLVLLCFAGSDVLCARDFETARSHKSWYVGWLPFRLYESILALGFYSLGLWIRRYADFSQFTAWVRSYAWAPVLAALLLLPLVYQFGFYPPVQSSALVLLGVSCTMSIGALCEQYLPRVCRAVVSLAPAAFFIYVTHYIVLHALRLTLTGSYGGTFTETQNLYIPLVILAICSGLFFLLRRIFPRFMRVMALTR